MKTFYAILCIAIASLTQLQAQAPQDINTIKEILGHFSLASTQEYAKVRLPKIVQV